MADNMFNSLDNENRSDVLNFSSVNFPSRSVFPYGRTSILAMNEGYLYPVDTFFVLPGDTLSMDMAAFLESLNPFVSRQYSGMKLCFHVWYQKCEHEWRGWKNYSTKGRRGNISLRLPFVRPYNGFYIVADGSLIPYDPNIQGNNLYANFDVQGSLCSYLCNLTLGHISNQSMVWPSTMTSSDRALASSFGMGDNTQVNRSFRIGVSGVENYTTINTSSSFTSVFNAIPFSFYQRVFRDEYLNQNLVKDNPLWFPDDEEDFQLPYAPSTGEVYSVSSDSSPAQFNNLFSLVPNNYTELFDSSSPDLSKKYADAPILTSMRCRQWSGDPFTTSVPFLERNGVTNLFTQVYLASLSYTPTYSTPVPDGTVMNGFEYVTGTPSSVNLNSPGHLTSSSPQVTPVIRSGGPNLMNLLNLNQLRELSAATLWSERNARAKGDYNSLIMAHYGRDPHSEDRRATYVGGFVQRLNFDTVVSNSTSQYSVSGGTVTEPLGSLTSRATCGSGSSINNFEVPDFGYVMILASLIPDTYYTQGLRPEFDASLSGTELPWPEFANLQKENVLMKRLFYFGNNTYDLKLIGFNERFLDFKYRSNVLLGHMADSSDQLFRSMTFARYFDYNDMTSFNSINNEFVTLSPYNCRSDMYTVPSQPHFILQFGDNVRLVRALPYASKESALTNIA